MRLAVLDAVRGVACLSVVLFHLAPKNSDWFFLFDKGYLGVYGFFVVSGLVIPLSLNRCGYTRSLAGRFMLKRLLRIHPPYVASIGLVLLLGFMANHLTVSGGGPGWPPSWSAVTANLFYSADIFHFKLLQYSYWTLPLEMQFYIFMACWFPLLVSGVAGIRALALGLCLLAGLLPGNGWLPHFLPCFGFGMLVFMRVSGLLSREALALWLVAYGGLVSACHSIWVGVACLATVLVITQVSMGYAWLSWLGKISYSLYLVHEPVGSFLRRTILRLFSPGLEAQWLAFIGGTAGSLAVAWLFWRMIEVPSMRWASGVAFPRTTSSV
jgi:peptidoglycan/LPS O-acetylase OafA/YrhL